MIEHGAEKHGFEHLLAAGIEERANEDIGVPGVSTIRGPRAFGAFGIGNTLGREQHTLDLVAELLRPKRFLQISDGAEIEHVMNALRRGIRRDDDYGNASLRARAEAPHEFLAIHHRHVDIGEDRVETLGRGHFEGLRSVARFEIILDSQSADLNHATDEGAHGGRVVDDQDIQRRHVRQAAPPWARRP